MEEGVIEEVSASSCGAGNEMIRKAVVDFYNSDYLLDPDTDPVFNEGTNYIRKIVYCCELA